MLMGMFPRWLGRAREQRDVEQRAAGMIDFAAPPLVAGLASDAGVTVTSKNAMGVPAMLAAVKRAAEQVAELEFGVWRGQPPMTTRVTSTWQARFFASTQPNDQQTWFEFFSTIEESVSFRGNAFIWKNKLNGRVVEAYALHPDQVLPLYYKEGRQYLVGVYPWYVDPTGKGNGFYEVDESTLTHVRGFGDGGKWIAPSPLDRERGGLSVSSALAKISHENATYKQGANPRLAISFKGAMTPEKMREWRQKFREQYEGSHNAGKTLALDGDASFQTIGMTFADAEFVESMQYSVEEICRIIDVPPSIIWGGGSGQTARAVGPTSPEHEVQRWLRYGLSPRLTRIESAFRSDPDWFPPGSLTFPAFATQNFIRGDLLTESQILVSEVQAGILLPDEARSMKGLPELPDGVGKIPQITPVGGAPNDGEPPAPSGSDPSA